MCMRLIPQKQPLIPSELSGYPWQKVRRVLLNFNRATFNLVVDYFFHFSKIIKLSSTLSTLHISSLFMYVVFACLLWYYLCYKMYCAINTSCSLYFQFKSLILIQPRYQFITQYLFDTHENIAEVQHKIVSTAHLSVQNTLKVSKYLHISCTVDF